jgi:hypothetical protein
MIDRHRRPGTRATARGAALLLAIILMAMLAMIGAVIMKSAGRDRIAAARLGAQGGALTCAESGLQFGRRYFGCAYKTSDNWNDFLTGARPAKVTGNLDGTTPGEDFEVSIHDDDDEPAEVNQAGVALGNDLRRDNNMTIVLESRCTAAGFAPEEDGRRVTKVLRALLTYVPGLSDHGGVTSSSNANEAAAGGAAMRLSVGDCE